MENYSKWDDEEIKTLFKFVEIKKQEGMPLIKIFAEYATKTLRHANSVRNYYYKELGNMLNNTKIADDFGINLKNHTITQSQPFSQNEELQVVNQINELKEQGYSVRRACLELSGGDISVMIRLQNKYRALTKTQKPKLSSDNNSMGQVIKMQPKQPKITDDEIKALFFGLIRIVKKQEQDSLKIQYENEIFNANEKLRLATEELVEKQKHIESLQNKLLLIKNELEVQKNQKDKSEKQNGKNKTAGMLLNKYFKEQKMYDLEGAMIKK